MTVRRIETGTRKQTIFPTITEAIGEGGAGDEFIVEGFEYPLAAKLTIPYRCRIKGVAHQPRFYRAPTLTAERTMVEITGSDVTIENLHFDFVASQSNTHPQGAEALRVEVGADRCTIDNCLAEGARLDNQLSSANNILINGDYARVINTTARDAGYAGIRNNAARHTLIAGCLLDQNLKLGIVDNADSEDLKILGCTIQGHPTDTQSSGILIDPGETTFLDRCEISDTSIDLPVFDNSSANAIKIERVGTTVLRNVYVNHPLASIAPSCRIQFQTQAVFMYGCDFASDLRISSQSIGINSDGVETFTTTEQSWLEDGNLCVLQGTQLPANLREQKYYYIVSASPQGGSPQTFKVALQPGGPPLAHGDAGIGSMSVKLSLEYLEVKNSKLNRENSGIAPLYFDSHPRRTVLENTVFDQTPDVFIRVIRMPETATMDIEGCTFNHRSTNAVYVMNGSSDNLKYSNQIRWRDNQLITYSTGTIGTSTGTQAANLFKSRNGQIYQDVAATALPNEIGWQQGAIWFQPDTGYSWTNIGADPEVSPTWVSWNAQVQNGTAGPTPTIDFSQGPIQSVVLDQDATFTILFPATPQRLLLIVGQDPTGGWTATWPILRGNLPVIATAPNTVTAVELVYDGQGLHFYG